MRTMEKELIETFLIIAKVNNISKASKMLYVSQATVSYRLKLLEKKLGTPLIQRSKGTRQTLLTTNGRRFLPLAQSWLDMEKMIYINCGYSFRKWYQHYVPLGITPTYSVDSYQLAWKLMKNDYWFFAPVCFVKEQLANGEQCAISALAGSNPTYDVFLAVESNTAKLRRYEITLFKRLLTTYFHATKHSVDAKLAELFPQKRIW